MVSSASMHQTAPAPARASGVYQTSPGLLRRRLVGPWGEGLAQYMALRVGDPSRGRGAYQSLLRLLGALPPEELLEAPGPKARLYRLARSIAETERAMPDALARSRRMPWRSVAGARGGAIDRLRAELRASEAELLELRHARELSIVEIACVLEEPADEIELWLDTAEARARHILGEHAPDPLAPRASVFVEAFALEPGWSDEGADEVPVSDEAPLEAGTVIGGRYAIVERVGVGAFGDVYRADDTEVPGHRVALKLLRQPSLSESARQAALRELRMNAAVFHPSLVQFKDHGWYEQRLWFVMPWYEGETLEQRMRRAPLTRPEARRIFEPLARALAALHAAGIRHQDVKPDNVLLTTLPGAREDEVLPVLIDLGVAADEQEGLLGGTPLYFAPEVAARFAGEGDPEVEVSSAADVFALALSLRNALEPSTQEDVPAGAIGAFIERRAGGMPPLPEARSLAYLRPTLARWLSSDPCERPSADELADELAVLTAPEERRARRLRVARWLVPLALAVAAVFALVVHHLDQRALARELEAHRARGEAADARADAIVADARRRALEEGQAALLARYEQSRLSRRELADRLATTEGQLGIVRSELGSTIAARDAAQSGLSSARRSLSEREAELATARGERDQERRAAEALARDLATARADLRQREQDVAEARGRARDLGAQLAAERTSRREAEQRASALEAELSSAREAEQRATRELGRVRAHVARLAAAIQPEPESPAPAPAEAAAEHEPPPE